MNHHSLYQIDPPYWTHGNIRGTTADLSFTHAGHASSIHEAQGVGHGRAGQGNSCKRLNRISSFLRPSVPFWRGALMPTRPVRSTCSMELVGGGICEYDALLGNQKWTSRADQGAAPQDSAWAACLPASVSPGYCGAPLHSHPSLASMQSYAMSESIGLAVGQPYCTSLGVTPHMWALTAKYPCLRTQFARHQAFSTFPDLCHVLLYWS